MLDMDGLEDFRQWCKSKAKKSDGTTDMYLKYLAYTPDITLAMPYSNIFTALRQRINTNSQRYAHILYLKYLKDMSLDFEHKKLANMLILDLKDMTIGTAKSASLSADELRYKVLTKTEISTIYDYVAKNNKTRDIFGKIITLTPIDILQRLIFIRSIYESAGRAEEIRQYDWEFINLKQQKIDVPKTITKRHKPRTAELSKTTTQLLIDYQQEQLKQFKKLKPVFFNFKNYHSTLKFIKSTCKEAIEKEVTPHWFRHSFLTHKAVDALKAGEDLAVIKEKLRDYVKHSTTTTTEIYIKLALEFKRERILEQYGEVP